MSSGNRWYAEHKAARRAVDRRKGWARFGLSEEGYLSILKKQKGVCAICGKPESLKYKGTPKQLAVDHSHRTGEIRGLLCFKCNTALGLLQENKKIVRRLLRYLGV